MFISADLQKIADVLWRVTYNEPETSQIAIAWAFRNKSRVHSGPNPQPELFLCHEILRDELDVLKPCRKQLSLHCDTSLIWRSMTSICRVWAGDVEDPTSGSTAFHLHNILPNWAVGLHPVALIGRRFFYNTPGPHHL